MKKIFLLFSIIILTPLLLAQTTYYSGGNLLPPDNVSSWFTNTDGTGSNPSNFSNSGDLFIIQSTHTMITSATWAPAGSVQINGTLAASNAVTVGGTLTVSNGGTYQHNQNGGTVPAATWQTGSNCVITGVTGTSAPGGLNQSFYNITWSSANTGPITINPSIISGNLSVTTGGTGSNTFGLASSNFTIGRSLKLSGTANFSIQAGALSQTLSVDSNFSMTAGTLNLSSGSAAGNLYIAGNFSQTGGTITETGSASGVIYFNGTGTQTYTSGGTVSNTVIFGVLSNSTLQMASSSTVVTGYNFVLNSGGTLGITSSDGISSSGVTGNIQTTFNTFNATGNYIYNGTGNQNTGNGLPNNLTGVLTINNPGNTVTLNNAETIANGGSVSLTNGTFATGTNLSMASTSSILRSGGSMTGTLQGSGSYNVTYSGNSMTSGLELNNSGLQNVTMSLASGQTVTAGGSITVNGNWTISLGTTFDAGSYTHNLNGNWSNSGTLTANTSTFNMSGSGAQTMSGSTFNNLTINNSSTGVSMLTDETVNGTLTLSSGNFNIGSHTLNINGAISVGSGSLVGGSTSNIAFGGAGASTTLPAITLSNLAINRANGITLGGSVTVTSLTLTNGNLTTSASNLLKCTSVTGGTATSYINGPLEIDNLGSGATFPIGKGSDYRPISLSSITYSSGPLNVKAELFNSGTGGTPPSGFNKLSTVHYWYITPTGGVFTGAQIQAVYGADDGVTNHDSLALVEATALTGTYQNVSGSSGGSADVAGTISSTGSIAQLYYFTFANRTHGTNPLPVELNSFTASVSAGTVTLKWETATEVNNYGFDVERSTDNQNWTKVGFVTGAGNSSSPKNYAFTDQPSGAFSFSYRLKQIDVDGAYKYYDAITVSLIGGDNAQLMQNSPNPFNPTTTIKYYIPQAMMVTLKIYDILGREITTLVNQQADAGYHIVYWNGRNYDGSSVSSGVYLYRLQAGNFVQTKKMIMMK